ncbi:hypothetical protein N7462_010657 [Penicillium macrosclerotiorum]|uniref:uncharacterized protein n=1 Tax=Penicillium macrosclerotiorum TaxID=303699 RepID=UPI002547E04C|nr:uncharacterized protein N7462_010657 [Penicillium macrosclerotiorum]KAJ5669587.1 hypothetical protein N7462_010657 [Penicillium macrosclerotiorum]
MGSPMPLEGRSLAIFVVSVVMMVVSFITVSLRTFVRAYIVRAFGWDDTLMVAALVLFLTLGTCCLIGSMNGIGHSQRDFKSLEVYKKALTWWWLGQMLYLWASAVAKISIALALLRLTVKRIHRMILWGIIGLVIVIGLMFWLILLLDCQPISYFWDRVDPTASGTCLAVDVLLGIAYLYSCLTIICDFTLGILPIILVWNLQMNRRTKIAVGGILSMGAVASVAVVIRLPFLRYYADSDFLYSTYQIAIWSIIETGLGIAAGSLITLRPLFRWLLDGSMSYGRNARSPGKSSGNYPLSSLKSDRLKGSNDPSYWRPDIDRDSGKGVINNTVSSPRSHDFTDGNSSQEALYPELRPVTSHNGHAGVTVKKTFVQVVEER